MIPTEHDIKAFDPETYSSLSNIEDSSPPAPLLRAGLPLPTDAFGEATLSYAEIISCLPSRANSAILIQRYLETVEGTHRLFHIPALHQELTNFWSDQSSVDYDWLAQLFVILALGYQASGGDGIPSSFSEGRTTSHSGIGIGSFIFAAQACLKKAGYMIMAKNTIIRALALMALVIQTSGYSCRNYDVCGPWLDTAVRHCMRLGYHKVSSQISNASTFDAYLAKRIWTTVTYLQLQQSMNSGTPLLLQPSDFEDDDLPDIDDEDMHPDSSCHCPEPVPRRCPGTTPWTGATCQVLLAKSMRAAVHVVSQANSPLDDRAEISFECMMRYDAFFRSLLLETASTFNGSASPMDNFRDSWRKYQRLTIETFFRRILLILHQPFGQRPKAHDNLRAFTNEASPPRLASHWSLLECSLAILVAQRQMFEDAPSGGPSSASRQFYEGLLKQDFFIAALFAGTQMDWEYRLLQYRQQYQPRRTVSGEFLQDPESNDELFQDPELFPLAAETPPRETITQTLRCCQSIWARSLREGNPEEKCNIWVYLVLGKLIDVLNADPGYSVGNPQVQCTRGTL